MAYHLIPYNFEEFDFDKLWKEENDHDSEVYWHHGSKIYGFNVGDTCYFYCTNLPDMTRRILLKAEISEVNCKDEEGVNCYKTKNISSIRLKEKQSNPDKFSYSLEVLKEKYGVACVRGKQRIIPDSEENVGLIEKREALLDSLEKEPSTGSLLAVKEYFTDMTKCVFEGKNHEFDINKTFYKQNGFLYYEIHHVLQQSLSKDTKKNKKLLRKRLTLKDLEDLRNKEYICPVCHRNIHSGKTEDIRDMIDYLYYRDDKKTSFFDECYSKYALKEEYKDTLEWLYAIYNVDKKSLKV